MVWPWVILGSVARVSHDDDDQLLSLALAARPASSSSSPPRSQGSLAAAGRAMVDESGRRTHVDPDVMLPSYFVCDLASATAFQLPDPAVAHHRNLALTAIPGGGHYMVADLRTIDAAADHATLLCFEWVEKTLPLLRYDDPLPHFDPADGAITHDARLWWVDLSRGLLTRDPFAVQPLLRFIPLPPAKFLLSSNKIDKYRCVKISAGKLRFVDIDRHAAKVTMWTLASHEEWVLQYQLSFQHLRADDSYKAVGLKEDSDSVLAFVHPRNPDVVYFLDEHLVGVDMRASRVVSSEL